MVEIKKCKVCGREIHDPKHKNRIYCSKSCCNQDPEYKAKISVSQKEYQNRPEVKKRKSATMEDVHRDPVKKANIMAGYKKPENIERMRSARLKHLEMPGKKEFYANVLKDPDVRAKYEKNLSEAEKRQETKANRSEAQKKRQENPDERKKISDSNKRTLAIPEVKEARYKAFKAARSKMIANLIESLKVPKEKARRSAATKKMWQDPQHINLMIATQRKNGTFQSSSTEDLTYERLCLLYGKKDVLRQYKEPRYPFKCDFYIKSLDLFIECHFGWTHCRRPFDRNDPKHIEQSKQMIEKSKEIRVGGKKKVRYQKMFDTWTETDPLKLKTAKDNRLNFLVFYNPKDAYSWIESQIK